MKTCLIPLIVAAGLLAGCNRSIENASEDFNTLPAAVQKAVRAQAPNAEIASVSHTTENGMEAYKIEFRQEGKNSHMTVTRDGRVVSTDLTSSQNGMMNKVERALTPTGAVGTKFSALPEAAQKTIQKTAPESEIDGISRHEENGRVIYEVSFKDQGKNPTIRVADDGTLVQALQK
jgi:uncharacterized membrane protein YkoI